MAQLGEGLLSVPEAAKIVGVGKTAIYSGIREGCIPHIKLGSLIVIPEQRFREWLFGVQQQTEKESNESKGNKKPSFAEMMRKTKEPHIDFKQTRRDMARRKYVL